MREMERIVIDIDHDAKMCDVRHEFYKGGDVKPRFEMKKYSIDVDFVKYDVPVHGGMKFVAGFVGCGRRIEIEYYDSSEIEKQILKAADNIRNGFPQST